jgi:quercetin dioxygenase-like cupin family protein
VQIIQGAGSWKAPQAGDANDWEEHFAVPALSVGTYCIPAGGTDDQSPHTEDEVYVVTGGRAKISTPAATVDVVAGSVIFVPADEEHRFVDVAEDLTLLVVFGPAFGTRSKTPDRARESQVRGSAV